MRNQIAAMAVAGLAAAGLTACGTPSDSQLASTASMTVNGNDVRPQVVRCDQIEWYRTIQIGDEASGARILIDQGVRPMVTKSVRITNLGGFTGLYSQTDGGDANTSFSGDKVTISGTANGFNTDKPSEPTTASFKISANC
ncbi:Mycobacterium 19 kDa lipoprotein antigen [Mycobacterium basiliense]|uniref:Mycobacterium 19 kDa lipoprotein antigen n=1 Tax=Mycobacterium basiliense TaxID=2094119 RepID=A0A447GJ12_9MYCO|nr:lipoprotein LpqH [Mycobacterium basiliense]VDM90492.1 Mycobacterium 19 kDa lipoprotein antigen [Mycobacterium basiliense]